MTNQNEYKKIYFLESEELLQEMNKGLLVLENEPQNEKALHAIFRAAHTLKSMSASMGYTLTADLSHTMEDVLSQIRNEDIIISENVVNLLFQSFDQLETMVLASKESKEFSKDITPLLDSLNKLRTKTTEYAEEEISKDIRGNCKIIFLR